MPVNIPMLRRGIHRLLAGRPVDIREVASRNWTLCPNEAALSPPAIHLPGAMDKIIALSPWRSQAVEQGLVQGGPSEHGASTGHLLEDVDLVGPCLYAGAAKSRPGFGAEPRVLRGLGPRQDLWDAHLITSNSGSHFFGTLMLDDFPLALLPEETDSCITMMSQPYEHEAGYRQLFGLPAANHVVRGRLRRLVIYTDFGQNSLKEKRYRRLRERLRKTLATNGASPAPGIYIRRGNTGERRILVNEGAIEQALNERGFRIIDFTCMDAETIARESLDARIVVGVEGSHLSHGIFTAHDEATFLVLQPPQRFAMAYKEYTDRMDMRFAFLVGDRHPEGFTVSIDELQRLLDIVENPSRSRTPCRPTEN